MNSRRDLLAAASALTAMAAAPRGWAAASPSIGAKTMKTRKLGPMEVSELGAGCMSISANYGPPADRVQGIATIRQGITLRLGEGRREEGHHAWIGVQGRERHAVCRRPWAKA